MHPDEMQLSKRQHKSVIEGVIMLLNQLDPYGVEPGNTDGESWDEYVSEAHPMASLLLSKGLITTDRIDEIWQKRFGEPLSVAVGATKAERFASSLNTLMNDVRRGIP
jgi:hypothetical protein